MFIKDIVKTINGALAGELCSFGDLKQFMDRVIDDINAQLNSKYPAFSELGSYDTDYNMFPERYIRTVVVPGAAWYYYVADEEGSPTAMQYQMDYNKGLFLMTRDMLYNIPEEYQAESLQGSVEFALDGDQGITVPYSIGEW